MDVLSVACTIRKVTMKFPQGVELLLWSVITISLSQFFVLFCFLIQPSTLLHCLLNKTQADINVLCLCSNSCEGKVKLKSCSMTLEV